MRILVCAWDFPYPPRGGGRADIWRRVEGFVRLGHEVMLLNLFDPSGPRAPREEDLAAVDQVVAARHSFAISRSRGRTLRQLTRLAQVPWHVANRVPDRVEQRAIDRAVRGFGPDLVWLDGPWFGEMGTRLADELGVPLAYRSHNVEHLYLRGQAAAAARRRDRIAWRLAAIGLERYQLRLMARADRVLDISCDDLEHWRSRGVVGARWLPPLPELALAEPSSERVRTDVLFVGGLRTPNNVQGVRWLVQRVLPLLRHEVPGIRVGVAGSYPDPVLAAELAGAEGVQTFFDVPDVTPLQFGARVLVNPVSVGSGVQLKMLDMLMTDTPVVSRRQGMAGLPAEAVELVDVADTPEQFAAAVLRRLTEPGVDRAARARFRAQFSLDGLRGAVEGVVRTTGQRGTPSGGRGRHGAAGTMHR